MAKRSEDLGKPCCLIFYKSRAAFFFKQMLFYKPNMSNKPNRRFSDWDRGWDQSLRGLTGPKEFCRAKSFRREQCGNLGCHLTPLPSRSVKQGSERGTDFPRGYVGSSSPGMRTPVSHHIHGPLLSLPHEVPIVFPSPCQVFCIHYFI